MKGQQGFSFLELVLVISIIGLLFTLAADRLLILQVEAERTAMQQVLGTIRSAMNLNVATHIARDNIDELANAEASNPMDWLSQTPDNYIGVRNEADPSDIESGKWYYDKYHELLIYRVTNSEYYESDLKGPARARFRVELSYTDNNDDGQYSANTDEIHGLKLAAVEPYKWLNKPVDIEDYKN